MAKHFFRFPAIAASNKTKCQVHQSTAYLPLIWVFISLLSLHIMHRSMMFLILHFTPSNTECSSSGVVFKILGCGKGDRAAFKQLKTCQMWRLQTSFIITSAPFCHRCFIAETTNPFATAFWAFCNNKFVCFSTTLHRLHQYAHHPAACLTTSVSYAASLCFPRLKLVTL